MPLLNVLTTYPAVGIVIKFLSSRDQISLRLSTKSNNYLLSNLVIWKELFEINCINYQGEFAMTKFRLAKVFSFPSAASKFLVDLNKLVTNCPLHTLYLEYMNSFIHWGLVSSSFIAKGCTVLPYIGEYISSTECERRHAERPLGQVSHEFEIQTFFSPNIIKFFLTYQKATYILTWKEHIKLNTGTVVLTSHVDATHNGGLARFINHSCEPNLQVCIERVHVSMSNLRYKAIYLRLD